MKIKCNYICLLIRGKQLVRISLLMLLFVGACSKNIYEGEAGGFKNLSEAVNAATQWYEGQIIGDAEGVSFSSENSPDWESAELRQSGNATSITVPVINPEVEAKGMSRKLIVTIQDDVFTGKIQELQPVSNITSVRQYSINGVLLEEGYFDARHVYHIKRTYRANMSRDTQLNLRAATPMGDEFLIEEEEEEEEEEESPEEVSPEYAHEPHTTLLSDEIWWNLATEFEEEIVPQTLPSWASMYSAYPKNAAGNDDMPAPQVFSMIGGEPLAIYQDNPGLNSNACAARVSRALNYSGVTIPYLQGHTFRGADGRYYFLGAAKLYNWLSKAFPNARVIRLGSSQGGPNGTMYINYLRGERGIYVMKAVDRSEEFGFGASGHATLFDGTDAIGGHTYFNPRGGLEVIGLWTLN